MLPIYLAELDTQEEKDLFEKLYREYKSKMHFIAMGILNNDVDAEDAVDMAFHRLAKNFTKISNKNCNETEGYIVICIRSAAIDIYRSNKRIVEKTRSIKEDDSSEDIWEQETEHMAMISAISALPDEYSDIIFLCDYQMLSAKEVSKLLNITEQNVRLRLHRAHKKLKIILKGGDLND